MMIGQHCRLVALVVVVLLAADQRCGAQSAPEDRLRTICDHWRQRQAEFPCLSYAWKATTTWMRGAFAETADEVETAPNPPADVSSTSVRSILLDFTNNRHNAVWNDDEYSNLKGVHYRLHCNHVCGGTTVYSRIFENTDPGLRPNQSKKHVDLLIQKGEVPAGVFTKGDFLIVLMAHGAIWYADYGPRPGKLVATTEFRGLKYDREEEYKGRTCSVVSTSRLLKQRTELWVDRELSDAVVKVVVLGRHPQAIYELDYVRVNEALVVSRWSRSQFDVADGRLRFKEDGEVTSVETSPKLSGVSFTIKPQVGMVVEEQDYFTDNTGRYRAREKLYQLDEAGEAIELDKQTLAPKNQ